MYKVDHIHLEMGEERTFIRSDDIEAIVVVSGNIEVVGEIGNQGPDATITVVDVIAVKALVPSHLRIVLSK